MYLDTLSSSEVVTLGLDETVEASLSRRSAEVIDLERDGSQP